MIRKLLLPTVAMALLAGCVTSDYTYRGGRGDYYYGQPRTEYRYHGYGQYGYGYPYDSRFYGRGYYGYGHPYGGYYPAPYYPGYGGYYPRPPIVVRPPHPGHGHTPPRPPHERNDRDGSPWRNLDEVRRRQQGPGPGAVAPQRVEGSAMRSPPPPVQRHVEPRRSSDSAMGERIRQVRERAVSQEVEPR